MTSVETDETPAATATDATLSLSKWAFRLAVVVVLAMPFIGYRIGWSEILKVSQLFWFTPTVLGMVPCALAIASLRRGHKQRSQVSNWRAVVAILLGLFATPWGWVWVFFGSPPLW